MQTLTVSKEKTEKEKVPSVKKSKSNKERTQVENPFKFKSVVYQLKIMVAGNAGGRMVFVPKIYNFNSSESDIDIILGDVDRENYMHVLIQDGRSMMTNYHGYVSEKNMFLDDKEIPGKGDPVSYNIFVSIPK